MIRRRLSAPTPVVYSRDEALLDGLDDDTHHRYCQTRDISLIPAEVLARCTVYHVRPLLVAYEHTALSPHEPGAAWRIFSAHVHSATNCQDERGHELLVPDREGRFLLDSVRDDIPFDVVSEIAGVCVKLAQVNTTPFFVPATLSRDRILYRARRALSAQTESASSPAPSSLQAKTEQT